MQGLGCDFEGLFFYLGRGGDSSIARHESDTTGIRAEVDGRKGCVGGLQVNTLGLDTQLFSNDIGKNRSRTLSDVGSATVDGNTTSTVEPDLYGGPGQIVPVDRLASATDVR